MTDLGFGRYDKMAEAFGPTANW